LGFIDKNLQGKLHPAAFGFGIPKELYCFSFRKKRKPLDGVFSASKEIPIENTTYEFR